jgi:hypothetical protein
MVGGAFKAIRASAVLLQRKGPTAQAWFAWCCCSVHGPHPRRQRLRSIRKHHSVAVALCVACTHLWLTSLACVRSPCHLVLLLAQTLPPLSSHSLAASPCPLTAHPPTSPMPLATQISSNGAFARAGHEQMWVLYSAAVPSHSLWPPSAGSLPARQVRCTSTCTPPRNQLLALCGAWCSHCSFESRARAAALQAERCKGPYTAVHAERNKLKC